MFLYTTGEVAKLCNVSTRTIQYYDNKDILKPTKLNTNGYRLYSEEDVKNLQWICLLKSLGFKLAHIKKIMDDEHSIDTILLILEQHNKQLNEEIQEKKLQLKTIGNIIETIKISQTIPTEVFKDIHHIMKNNNELRKIRTTMLSLGIFAGVIEYSTLFLAISKGEWKLFGFSMLIVVVLASWILNYYYKSINYICPKCHTIFKPKFKEFFWAKHTFKTRRLTCSCCNVKSFCLETTDKLAK